MRASNTTPVLVLRFEADNEAAIQRIRSQFKRVLLAARPNLSIPG
jgi:phosphomannomutase/phosphoglucomutase